MDAREGPDLLPELGEAVNGPIIQVIVILQGLIIFLVDELPESPHVTRRGVLVFPEGALLDTRPRGLHVGPDEWRRRIEGNQELDRAGMLEGTAPERIGCAKGIN